MVVVCRQRGECTYVGNGFGASPEVRLRLFKSKTGQECMQVMALGHRPRYACASSQTKQVRNACSGFGARPEVRLRLSKTTTDGRQNYLC